jgi:hypothetical protein
MLSYATDLFPLRSLGPAKISSMTYYLAQTKLEHTLKIAISALTLSTPSTRYALHNLSYPAPFNQTLILHQHVPQIRRRPRPRQPKQCHL